MNIRTARRLRPGDYVVLLERCAPKGVPTVVYGCVVENPVYDPDYPNDPQCRIEWSDDGEITSLAHSHMGHLETELPEQEIQDRRPFSPTTSDAIFRAALRGLP